MTRTESTRRATALATQIRATFTAEDPTGSSTRDERIRLWRSAASLGCATFKRTDAAFYGYPENVQRCAGTACPGCKSRRAA